MTRLMLTAFRAATVGVALLAAHHWAVGLECDPSQPRLHTKNASASGNDRSA